jgi:hypothetical protein
MKEDWFTSKAVFKEFLIDEEVLSEAVEKWKKSCIRELNCKEWSKKDFIILFEEEN